MFIPFVVIRFETEEFISLSLLFGLYVLVGCYLKWFAFTRILSPSALYLVDSFGLERNLELSFVSSS